MSMFPATGTSAPVQGLLTIGWLINPVAGIGGSVALKGSDTREIVARAKQLGGKSPAPARARRCLEMLVDHLNQRDPSESRIKKLRVLTCGSSMGIDIFQPEFSGVEALSVEAIYEPDQNPGAQDTRKAISAMMAAGADLIVFAGGDGTARVISEVIDDDRPVLGIPSGVKMHSGIFANSPEAAGTVLIEILEGRLVSVTEGEVRDIDEEAFRRGEVKSRYFATLRVPEAVRYIQQVKSGGLEVEALVIEDIAAYVVDHMEEETVYFIGSGTTPATIMERLGLGNTLLGIDIIQGGKILVADAREDQLYDYACGHAVRLVVTPIGGQGHLFGRGNQQFSPRVLRKIGRESVDIISSKSKLESLQSRPLLIDTGSRTLDREWAGLVRVITGYEDAVLYRLEA